MRSSTSILDLSEFEAEFAARSHSARVGVPSAPAHRFRRLPASRQRPHLRGPRFGPSTPRRKAPSSCPTRLPPSATSRLSTPCSGGAAPRRRPVPRLGRLRCHHGDRPAGRGRSQRTGRVLADEGISSCRSRCATGRHPPPRGSSSSSTPSKPDGAAYVHCGAGVGRTGAMVAAYRARRATPAVRHAGQPGGRPSLVGAAGLRRLDRTGRQYQAPQRRHRCREPHARRTPPPLEGLRRSCNAKGVSPAWKVVAERPKPRRRRSRRRSRWGCGGLPRMSAGGWLGRP